MTVALAALAFQSFLSPDPKLDTLAAQVASEAKAEFKDLKDEQFAIAVGKIDRAAGKVQWGQLRADQEFYPASTVKLFYISYAATQLEKKKLKMTDEFQRAVTDMIVESSNDATALVLDTITGTTGGPELAPSEFQKWQEKRNAVNKWLTAQGFTGINLNQKTWNEGPYGRERQSLGPKYENRNSLTPHAALAMMSLIALDKVANPEWSAWIKKPLNRVIPANGQTDDFQAKAFTGGILPKGSELWSKAGYTDTVRHDIAWFKLPNGHEYVFAVFTKAQSNEPKLIPFISEHLIQELEK